jgi:hypothetical protein
MHEWADCHWADVWLLREIARYAIDDLTRQAVDLADI